VIGEFVDREGRAMVSRFVASSVTLALYAAVLFLGLFLDQCSCQAAPKTVVLGGDVGWTSGAAGPSVNYTEFMAAVAFKAGDTLRKISLCQPCSNDLLRGHCSPAHSSAPSFLS